MRIKDMLEDSRPRERLAKYGISSLSDSELLALILQQGTCGENVT
jgi:DNA repair protein RadC